MPTDKKANTLWQAHHLSDISCPCVCHSVFFNGITGDAASHLATVVLEHAMMTDFCGIPLASLRENSITELDLENKAVGMPGVIVLSKLLPSAAALTLLKCACRPKVFAILSAPIDTPPSHGSLKFNQLCGLDSYANGTYTAEGITKLCEALKGSAVTALKCAAAQECSLPCQRPLTLPLPTFAAWATTGSAASACTEAAPTPQRVSPSCARGSRGAP
jgi:hypothetical protein